MRLLNRPAYPLDGSASFLYRNTLRSVGSARSVRESVTKRSMFRAQAGAGTRPSALPSLDLPGLAKFIKSGDCKNIIFLTGAGVSVGAGIPDFRSPGGMYDTLRPELLTATDAERSAMRREPTTVVSWELFQRNPFPYLELRRPFILGVGQQQWRATASHWFMRLCADKGLLRRVYTQNIDGLDFQLQLPAEKLVNVHGSMGSVSCERCGAPYPYDEFQAAVRSSIKDIYGADGEAPAESAVIGCRACGAAAVKPDTVLYGRQLPARFFECREDDVAAADLLVIAGTSLTVGPANSLASLVGDRCVRAVFNVEEVGAELGLRYGPGAARDVFCRGACDDRILRLVEELGWMPDLRRLCPAAPEDSRSRGG